MSSIFINHKTFVLFFSFFISLAVFANSDAEKRGLEIATINDKANTGFKSESSKMTMQLINAHGDVISRKMLSEVLEGQNEGDKSVVIFEWPADVKGTKMLTHTKKKGDDKQWLFLPALKRVKRISSRNKSGSFMGSEFSYEDLGSQELEKFKYKLVEELKLNGRDCWKLERVPVDKRSGYSKQLLWSDKEYNQPLKIEYYDRKKELLKTAEFKDYKKYGKFWRVGKIEMKNVQTKKSSIISWEGRKLGVEADEESFDSSSLAD